MMSKDEVSDLKSHIDLVRTREKELLLAGQALNLANSNLETFLHYQQFPKK